MKPKEVAGLTFSLLFRCIEQHKRQLTKLDSINSSFAKKASI